MGRSACLPSDAALQVLLGQMHGPAGREAAQPRLFRQASKPVARDSRERPAATTTATKAAPSYIRPEPAAPPTRAEPSSHAQRPSARPSSPELGLAALETTLAQCESLQERFAAVGGWLSRRSGAKRVFVVDDEGLPLDDMGDEVYGAAAGDLGLRIKATQAFLPELEESSARLKMKSGERLELVWCDTSAGRFGVGAVSTEPLPANWIALVPSALKRALETS